jgi:GTPase SAR1 family protein
MKPEPDAQAAFKDKETVFDLWEIINYPGLTPHAAEIPELSETLRKRLAVLEYKRGKSLLWIVFIGGTGTGKSTLFNALCGKDISKTGVERPKTKEPLLYVQKGKFVTDDFPFSRSFEINDNQNSLNTDGFVIVEHGIDEIGNLALVDSPDVDSLDIENRELAEDLYLLADAVVFVTSQEKYADEMPSRFLYRIREEGTPCFFILNKAEDVITKGEVKSFYHAQGIDIQEDEFWLVPLFSSPSVESISNNSSFREFSSQFFHTFDRGKYHQILSNEEQRSIQDLERKFDRLVELLEGENNAGSEWLDKLNSFFDETSGEIIEQIEEKYGEENQEHLKSEIRNVFGKYDVLAKPRKYVSWLIAAPLRILGFGRKETPEVHKKDFRKVRKKVDVTPVLSGINRFNIRVLENLSPADGNSPLYKKIRDRNIELDEDEVKKIIWEEQEKLALWLEKTFESLASGISSGKKVGIYSTSIIWGALILLFEIVVLGGGLTLLEAVLDSFLAPLVTKGSVELFAYHEIQKVARELNSRYREGLLSILREQKTRYEVCLADCLPSQEAIQALRSYREKMGDWG